MRLFPALITALGLTVLVGMPVQAEVPKVATDIAPVQSLVARVMQGVGVPTAIVPTGASVHHYALRPSQLRALGGADLVVWVGPGLTPWLDRPVQGRDAMALRLDQVEDVVTLPFRENAIFGADSHDHSAMHEDDHAHGAGAVDPHMWLDPRNAALWLGAIARQLGTLDPENADTYRRNAVEGVQEITTLEAEIASLLDPMRDRPFLLLHDAFHYFEDRFDFPSYGAISASDAALPSPARIASLRAVAMAGGVVCVFGEAGESDRMLRLIAENTGIAMGQLDPMGMNTPPGAAFYPRMLRQIAADLRACLIK